MKVIATGRINQTLAKYGDNPPDGGNLLQRLPRMRSDEPGRRRTRRIPRAGRCCCTARRFTKPAELASSRSPGRSRSPGHTGSLAFRMRAWRQRSLLTPARYPVLIFGAATSRRPTSIAARDGGQSGLADPNEVLPTLGVGGRGRFSSSGFYAPTSAVGGGGCRGGRQGQRAACRAVR